MPAIARDKDLCGGAIQATALRTFVNGEKVARLGDRIAPHGENQHAAAVMAEASAGVIAEGIPICRVGDKASCGHAITVGSPDAFDESPKLEPPEE